MITTLLIALLAIPSPVPHHRVHDFGDVLSPDVESQLETLSAEIDIATTAELGVVTVPSLEGITVEEYAQELFNKWGIGKPGINNGVLLLVAIKARRMRIEVGYGLEPLLTDGLCGEIRDVNIIPHFKAGDFSSGIVEGAGELARILRENPQAAAGVPGSAPAFVMTKNRWDLSLDYGVIAAAAVFMLIGFAVSRRGFYPSTLFALGALFISALAMSILYRWWIADAPSPNPLPAVPAVAGILAAVSAIFVNARTFLRYGPHACKRCGGRLTLLDEVKDDEKLEPVQRLEEQIGSVDYDVWICPLCLITDTEPYIASFSGFSTCAKCGHRTFKEESSIVKSPTTDATGTRRIDGTCVSCKFAFVHYEVIPIISSSSDSGGSSGSGGGSFGGGSSGGGGASGGW